MKIAKITVENYKAISNQDIELNGASAIVTAGNNRGKTSLLRGLIDRFRGEKPEIIVKQGEKKGFNVMELTDGSRIEWKFTEKGESFAFITNENIKMTTGVLSHIGKKYFGIKFDIDKFLNSSKREQLKQVQELVVIDLSKLENEYKQVYDERTIANRELKRLASLKLEKPERVEMPDIDNLKQKKTEIEKKNEQLKAEWKSKNEKHLAEIQEHNNFVDKLRYENEILGTYQNQTRKFLNETTFDINVDFEKILSIGGHEIPEKKPLENLPEPEYLSTSEIDAEIEKAYELKSKSDAYERDLKAFNDLVEQGKKARQEVEKLNTRLQNILDEKLELIKNSNLPDEFEMTDEWLLYKGLPFDTNQISSSAKYIGALKLGALALGDIKSLHFDASFLDNNSLKKIQDWADNNDYQLLIERPDYDGGEIKYEIIEK